MPRKSELTDIEVIVHHETALAILVSLTEDSERVWLPLSAVEIERKGRTAEIALPERLAIEKGLV